MFIFTRILHPAMLGLLFLSLGTSVQGDTDADNRITTALQEQITVPDHAILALAHDWNRLQHFYQARNLAPAWLENDEPGTAAIQLRQALHTADVEGLNPADYHIYKLEQLWHNTSPNARAILDILLTDAFFRYALHVRMGRLSPSEADPKWHLAAPETDLVRLLAEALAGPDFAKALADLPPPHSGYKRLRAALAHYRDIARNNGWPELEPGPLLREGMQHPQVRVLRQRLAADGTLRTELVEDAERYDRFVKYAVEQFQVRHGLKMDGVVGPDTRAALNVPVSQRITQLKLNMARWRWLPRSLGKRYIIVNTAAFELSAYENDQTLLTMWVVIGKQQRQTPVIGGSMHTVVFNPYWTVPLTLAIEDIIPAQLANPDYMQKRGIRVLADLANNIEVDPATVNWRAYNRNNFPYVLRQDPGPANPLGRVKFLFANNFEIYLHDTPSRRLFQHKQRTFSSGCIRVEDPLQLAIFLLGPHPDWDETRISEVMYSDETLEVGLSQRTPVYLLYLTSWVGQDGAVYFFQDIYARDTPLETCVSASADETQALP